jgi:hypothetical protein
MVAVVPALGRLGRPRHSVPAETAPEERALALVHGELVHVIRRTGPAPLAVLVTEHADNDFPRLPVRTDGSVVAVFGRYPDEDAHRRHLAAVSESARLFPEPPQVLRLGPTGRSLIR